MLLIFANWVSFGGEGSIEFIVKDQLRSIAEGICCLIRLFKTSDVRSAGGADERTSASSALQLYNFPLHEPMVFNSKMAVSRPLFGSFPLDLQVLQVWPEIERDDHIEKRAKIPPLVKHNHCTYFSRSSESATGQPDI
jgi:hypothetical protein